MSGDATSGGIFLDARGACIGCFVVPLGISFSFHLELIDCSYGSSRIGF